jgi:hypothetical protein
LEVPLVVAFGWPGSENQIRFSSGYLTLSRLVSRNAPPPSQWVKWLMRALV